MLKKGRSSGSRPYTQSEHRRDSLVVHVTWCFLPTDSSYDVRMYSRSMCRQAGTVNPKAVKKPFRSARHSIGRYACLVVYKVSHATARLWLWTHRAHALSGEQVPGIWKKIFTICCRRCHSDTTIVGLIVGQVDSASSVHRTSHNVPSVSGTSCRIREDREAARASRPQDML